MTLKEVAAILGKSEKTIKYSFKRTQENLRKKGIILMKWGYGKDADYEIEYERFDSLEEEDEE